jgi:nudix-type nucleoside diphosphatase (YffH/AdpP family)
MAKEINIKKTEILSDNWSTLKKVTYEYQDGEGNWVNQVREVYDRGNGATILLYNIENQTVVLTKQFRLPAFLNGHESGMMIEACAGLLDDDTAEDCIKKETEEETGYKLPKVQKIFEAYMSPGANTEILHFFIGQYSHEMKKSEGGGLSHEQENIEVLELDFQQACNMIKTGEIKDSKTIMLLQYAQITQVFNQMGRTFKI